MDELRRRIFIDDRLESYQSFFSDDWGHRISSLISDAPQLDRLVFDLITDWRGAAYTVSFPAQMLEQFRAFADAYVNTPEPNTGILQFADKILAKLSQDLPELSVSPGLQRELHQKLVAIAAKLRETHSQVLIPFTIDELWQKSLADHVYQLTIWSSLRICYVAIYNAYDNFVVQCMSLACNDSRIRTTDRLFKDRFKTTLGEQTLQKCWTCKGIHIAQLVRHALSHAGGRETRQLRSQQHDLRVEDGVIHILPINVKELYSTLKDAAFALAEIAKDRPEFQVTKAACG